MVINSLLKIGMEELEGIEYINPLLEARLLLEYILDVDQMYILINGNSDVNEDDEKNFLELIKKRKTGYPLQYIIKNANFMGLDFYVEEGVLIPRSDTEVLVEYLLEYIDDLNTKDINLLDIGIGSGAIVLSTAYFKPYINAFGIDIENKPIEVTEKNIKKLEIKNVKILKGNLFEPIDNKDYYNYFDIITSNPPYIDTEVIKSLQKEVKDFEPMIALDGGEDGLDFYRKIVLESKKFLRENGLLIFEIGYDQGIRVSKLLEQEEFKNIKILKDIQKLDRVVLGFK